MSVNIWFERCSKSKDAKFPGVDESKPSSEHEAETHVFLASSLPELHHSMSACTDVTVHRSDNPTGNHIPRASITNMRRAFASETVDVDEPAKEASSMSLSIAAEGLVDAYERGVKRISYVVGEAKERTKKLLSDIGTRPSFESHHVLITERGRLKLLHREAHHVLKTWEEERECGRDSFHHSMTTRTRQCRIQTPTRPNQQKPAAEVFDPDATTAIEFESNEVFEQEDAKENAQMDSIFVYVRRVGDLRGRVAFTWEIRNGNIDSTLFDQIDTLTGEGVFEPGDEFSMIKLSRIHDTTWNAENCYIVHITKIRVEPKSLPLKVTIGRNNHACVYFVNDDRFPADIKQNPTLADLITGFWKHNYRAMPKRTLRGIILAIYPGINYYVAAIISERLVDCGISREEKQCEFIFSGWVATTGEMLLCILALAQVLLHALMHMQEVSFRRLRLGGRATKSLRTNLTKALLDISFEERLNYDSGDIPNLIVTEVQRGINNVWLASFTMITLMSTFSFQFIIVITTFNSPEFEMQLALRLACPLMVAMQVATLLLTARKHTRLAKETADKTENWFAFLTMAAECAPVITGYQHSDTIVTSIDQRHAAINKANCEAVDELQNDMWVLRWGFVLVQFLVVIMAGRAAQDNRLSPGQFVVLVRSLVDLGKNLVKLANLSMVIFEGASAIQKIANLLNRSTRRSTQLKAQTETHMDAARQSSQIAVEDISYSYLDCAHPVLAVPAISFVLKPGQLVCLPRNLDGNARDIGINTLFSIMARQIQATSGFLKIPERWRVIYVPVTPFVLDGTLMYNLMYGHVARSHQTDDWNVPTKEVVWETCRKVGMSSRLIGNEDFDVGTNGEALKFSDRLCVSIVRALLYDVDLLLVSSALDVLGESHAGQVLALLRSFVDAGGYLWCLARSHLQTSPTPSPLQVCSLHNENAEPRWGYRRFIIDYSRSSDVSQRRRKRNIEVGPSLKSPAAYAASSAAGKISCQPDLQLAELICVLHVPCERPLLYWPRRG